MTYSMKKNMKKILLLLFALLLLAGVGVTGYIYSVANTGFDAKKVTYIYVDQSRDYGKVIRQIKDSAKVQDISNFKMLASYRGYPGNIKTGRYAIEPTDNVWTVVNKLNRGLQTPTKVTFNNIRLKADLVERISEQLMFTDAEFMAALNDSARCASYGFNTETIIAMFIPNTYEFYWDVAIDSFLARMKKEYDSFWTAERLEKAKQLNLTPVEVASLAAIVEEECTLTKEYPIVAGLYLNRLKIGQLLQADPTLKYAVGDFSLQRVLDIHKTVDSPYNTYKYKGLTPSPIRIPSIKGINAVLNPAKHNYYYMCAKEDLLGEHNFANSLAEHNRNANRYRQALNQRKIYR